jgi:hypothetical protein
LNLLQKGKGEAAVGCLSLPLHNDYHFDSLYILFSGSPLVTQTYSTGVRLTKKAMQEIEHKIQRFTNLTEDNLPSLGKWFIDICCGVT